jgi:hypothetical protein
MRREATWDLPVFGDGLPMRKVFGGSNLFELFPPVQDSFGPVARTTGPSAPWLRASAFASELLLAGALLLMVFRFSLTNRIATLGVATAAAVIVASPLLVLYDYYVSDTVNFVVRRFGISALPAIALVTAAAVRGRLGYALIAVVAAGMYATALLTLT